MIHPAEIRRNLDARLYRLGFVSPIVRHLLATQVIITTAGFACGLLCLWFTLWPLTFAMGAAIATFSLWQISRFAQGAILQRFSAALAIQFGLSFTLRLVIVAVVLFVLVIRLSAPVAPLVLGLTSTVVGMSLWGLSRLSRKTVKEA